MQMLDDKQANRAIKALLKYVEKKKEDETKQQLIEDSQFVWLIVATKKISESSKTKPCRIPLKHSILPLDAEICIFVKDPQKLHKELFETKEVKRINKVIGISKLRDEYRPFEAKRNLCNSYNLFLADDRVIPLLPKLLGKTFFEKKKQPVPVNLMRSNLKAEIERACDSTYMHLGSGTCCAIKIGTTAQNPTQVFENLQTALPRIIEKIPRKWKNIQSLHVKTSDSISLPIYNSLPDEPSVIKVGKKEAEAMEEDGEVEVDGESI